MKKNICKVISVFLVVIFIFSISACSNSKQITENEKATESPKQIKTLTFMSFTSWIENTGAQAAFDLFNSQKSQEIGARLEFEKVPEGEAGENVITVKYASGEVPDLVWWQGANIKIDAVKHFVEFDEKEEWTKNFGDLSDTHLRKDGKLYGIPFGDSTAFVMFYNKKVFEKAGVSIPKDWQEMLNVCEIIKNTGITPVYYSGKDAWTLQLIPIAALASGADQDTLIFDLENNKKKWADVDFLKDAIAKTKELLDKGYVQNTWLSDTYQQAQQALLDGTAAMYCNGTWLVGELTKISTEETVNSDIGAFIVPLKANQKFILGVPRPIFVSKMGKYVELAKKTALFFASLEANNAWFKAQPGVPFIKGVSVDMKGPFKDIADAVNKGLGTKDFTAYGIKGYAWNNSFDRNMQDLLVNGKTVQQVLEAMDAEYEKQAKAKNDPDFSK